MGHCVRVDIVWVRTMYSKVSVVFLLVSFRERALPIGGGAGSGDRCLQ